MALDPKKVLEVARGEIGYLEKKSNSNLDSKTANAGSKNITKYARDMDAIGFYNGKKQGVAWCDMFVDWCFVKAYGLKAALAMTFQPLGKKNSGAGCQYSFNYYKNKGRIFKTPQPGDQIFFWNSTKTRKSHTGIVEKVSGGKVYTIEGNTSGASGVVANGGGVKAKSYALNYSRIAGYGRPDWNVAAEEAPATTPTPETLAATPSTATPPTTTAKAWGKLKVTGNTVNIRTGPGTQYTALEQVKKGEVLVIPEATGWTPVIFGGHVYWISDKYTEIQKEG